MGCFGFGSKMIRKDSSIPFEKAVNFKVVQLSDDHLHHHALPAAKLFLVDPESREKRDVIGIKLTKQFDEESNTLEGFKSNQVNESNGKIDSQKKRGGSSRSKLEGEAIAAMSMLMVILVIMLICGRLCAIICASICFYCLPRFIKTDKKKKRKKKKDLNEEKDERIEIDSAAYRRKVVLEGILARKHKIDIGIS